MLKINGSDQRIRMCASRDGLPPVLIAQAGPGLPLLNDADRFQKSLDLESNFQVAYWDQRGCGKAPSREAQSVTFESQVDDFREVIRWLSEQTGQKVAVMGISLGATFALQAVAQEEASVKALVAVSIDTDVKDSDAAAFAYLLAKTSHPTPRNVARLVEKLGPPPITDLASFQLRARLLADLGGIERDRRFGEMLRGLLLSLLRTYGLFGTISALRNMNIIQRNFLPKLPALDLFANWPRLTTPTHYIFGENDPLITPTMLQKLKPLMTSRDTLVTVPGAGHMAHFDAPAVVRAAIVQAHAAS